MNQMYGVLIIDETPEGRAQLRKEAMAAGISVVSEATSSQEGFSRANELRPDAFLVSVEEPVARGLHDIETLAVALPDIPIIAVSTKNNRELTRKAVLAGARDAVGRPLRSEDLAETLDIVVRQAEKRRLNQSNPSLAGLTRGTVVSVFGPKGGIGKSTLAINLGVCVSSANKERAILVDLDTQIGAAAVMLNLTPQRTILDLAQNVRHMDMDLVKGYVTTHSSGLDVLAAPVWSGPGAEELDEDLIEQLLGFLAAHYDYVIVDTPPRLDPVIYRTLQMSTYILLLTSLEVASIYACKRVLEKIGSWEFAKDKIKVVLNAPNNANSLGPIDVEEVLGYPVFWTLPHDINVATASQLGEPVVKSHPNSKASQAIVQLHYTLSGSPQGAGKGLGNMLKGWKR